MIMVEGSELDIINLKFLLLCFEAMSGLKINFDKSEVVIIGYSEEEQQLIADNLNCRLTTFPVTYLGMPVRDTRILAKDLDPLVERVKSRAEPWQGRFTSKGSKTVLIDSCLSSLATFMMGMYILPEGTHGNFDKDLSKFFWMAANGRQKYHMVKWADICAPKELGGIGILASRRMNEALMLRWVWRILRGEGSLWLQLVRAKYLRGCPLLACERRDGSQFWRAIQAIKHEIRLGASFSVGDGRGTLFWLDPWLDGRSIRQEFPQLFAICLDPMLIVASAASHGRWEVGFRRTFGPEEAQSWARLLATLPRNLSASEDTVSWTLAPSGCFSVRSAYRALFRGPVLPWTSPLWKAPLPLKIKIFIWQLLRDRLPSGVEVVKRIGPGDGTCPLCAVPETGVHILFSCPAAHFLWSFVSEALGPEWQARDLGEFLEVQANRTGKRSRLFWLVFGALTWTLWTIRNKMVIERVFLRRASDAVFKFLAFLQQWHPLCRRRDRMRLDVMIEKLLVAARHLHTPSSR